MFNQQEFYDSLSDAEKAEFAREMKRLFLKAYKEGKIQDREGTQEIEGSIRVGGTSVRLRFSYDLGSGESYIRELKFIR